MITETVTVCLAETELRPGVLMGIYDPTESSALVDDGFVTFELKWHEIKRIIVREELL